jgi:hypothetical protein
MLPYAALADANLLSALLAGVAGEDAPVISAADSSPADNVHLTAPKCNGQTGGWNPFSLALFIGAVARLPPWAKVLPPPLRMRQLSHSPNQDGTDYPNKQPCDIRRKPAYTLDRRALKTRLRLF